MSETPITDALSTYIKDNASIRKPDGKYHPSGLFGCDRKTIYEVLGTPKTDTRDDRSFRILEMGQIVHDFVQKAILTQYDEAYDEIKLSIPDLNIVGSADLIVRVGDEWEVVELKTINSRAFQYGDTPKVEHVMQLQTYMYAIRSNGFTVAGVGPTEDVVFDAAPFKDLTKGRLVYISKDDMKMAEYTIEYSEELARSIVDKVAKLDYHLKSNTLPERLPEEKGKKHWLCGYCEFKTKCWEVDSE